MRSEVGGLAGAKGRDGMRREGLTWLQRDRGGVGEEAKWPSEYGCLAYSSIACKKLVTTHTVVVAD